jgi:hypothetical protein
MDLRQVFDRESSDKYFTTRALEWFDGIKDRCLSWSFDSHHLTAVASFVLGALVVEIEPDAFSYAQVAAGLLLMLLFVAACLVPFAVLFEWALRKLFAR